MSLGSASGERAARWGIGLWALLWVVNDVLPYFGGRDDSCQTMFSSQEWGVGPDGRAWNNHLIMPQAMWLDAWVVLELVGVQIEGAPIDARDRSLFGWIEREDRARSLEAVRVVIAQLCERHAVALRYRHHWPSPSGDWGARREPDPFLDVADACADPYLSSPAWWVPVRRYETDFPLPPSSEDE